MPANERARAGGRFAAARETQPQEPSSRLYVTVVTLIGPVYSRYGGAVKCRPSVLLALP